MKNWIFSIIFILVSVTGVAAPTSKVDLKQNNSILDNLVGEYSSSSRIEAAERGFYANNIKKNLADPKAVKKRHAKKRITVQQFQFELDTTQQGLRQIKFDEYILGGQIKSEIAQKYCNRQNLRMLNVAISVLKNEEVESNSSERAITSESQKKREINFLVKGSCVAYREPK
jgi:hypothetical protein